MTTLYRFARRHVQWKLCGTNFGGNIANLWLSCYNGNNYRSTRVLFVQNYREQGEWLRYTWVLTASFAQLLGCRTNNTIAARSLSPKHTISIGRGKHMSSYSAYVTHNRKSYFPITHYASKRLMQFRQCNFQMHISLLLLRALLLELKSKPKYSEKKLQIILMII